MGDNADLRLHAVISGRVQRVGFRSFAAEGAIRLELTGWVRNLPDGTVEVVAEGDGEKLKAFLQHLRSGPLGGRVDDIQSMWLEAAGKYSRFRIRWAG